MSDKSLPAMAGELWELVLTYLKQETVDPVKRLGRFLGFGVAGAVAVAVGLTLLALAGLRALQTETDGHLGGNLTWAPYAAVLVVAAVVAMLAARAIGSAKRRARRKGTVG